MDVALGRGDRGNPARLKTLLDTHFLLWVVLGSPRISEFPWLDRYRPWGVSPVSFLEIQYLSEVGRVAVRNPQFAETVMRDPRFIVDEVPLLALIRHAYDLAWTRDPFNRLLSAHSATRRIPLCTTDRVVQGNHTRIVTELRDRK